MPLVLHNPNDVYLPYRCYRHAVEIKGDSRLLIIRDLNGCRSDGKTLPEPFDEQCDQIWTHLRPG